MVLLFSAAKTIPPCRPRALGLQRTLQTQSWGSGSRQMALMCSGQKRNMGIESQAGSQAKFQLLLG